MANLGKLLVELAADTASFKSDMGRAARAMEQQTSRIEKSGKRMDRMFVGLKRTVAGFATGFVAAFGAQAIARTIGGVTARVQELQQTADILNFPVVELQRYQIAAKEAGVNTNTLTTSFQRFNRRVSEAADGTGEAQNALRELGLDAQRLEDLDTPQALQQIADAAENIASKDDRLRLFFKLFDSEGVRPILNTLEALKQLDRGYDDLILDQQQIDALVKMRGQIDKLTISLQLLAAQAVNAGAALVAFIQDFGAEANELSLRGVRVELQETSTEIQNLIREIDKLESQPSIFPALTGLKLDEKKDELKELQQLFDELTRREANLVKGPPKTISIKGGQRAAENINFPSLLSATPSAGPTLSGPLGTFDADIEDATQLLEARLSPALDEAAERTMQLQRGATSAGYAFTSAFRPSTVAANTLADSLENVALRLADILFQFSVADPFTRALGGLFSPTAGPVVSSQGAARFLNTQPRAFGGSVTAGDAYLVGERGPELFVSGKSGRIVPNSDLGGTNVTFNVNAMDSQSVLSAIAQHERQIVGMVRKGYARRGSRVDL